MVYDSYLRVVSKDGGAGIDRQSIEMFDKNLPDNLYKIWNRMASGSYFPPAVRTVFIPKKQGGLRPLGIPTVSDRIAQGVVKDYLEPVLETIFHPSSYGYRPGRGAHGALAQCRDNCVEYAWVVDVDIKGFFDNISHSIMMQLLQKHTREKWVLVYAGRWLKAGVEQEDGSIAARQQGTPQGGVISPLLANLYLHHAFDCWMGEANPQCPFERYADDIVIHCSSKEQAEKVLALLTERMAQYALTLHPGKTKIVYCKNYQRPGRHEYESFTFLSYTFQPRGKKDKFNRGSRTYIIFAPAISSKAQTSIREALRAVLVPNWTTQTLGGFAEMLNPKIRGWVNYYGKFYRNKTLDIFYYTNELIRRWIKEKYRKLNKTIVYVKYAAMQAEQPELFYHWKLGITS